MIWQYCIWPDSNTQEEYTFYRATVFAVARCLSVRHVHVLYPVGWRHRQTFYRPGSPIILVLFDPECRCPISRGPSAFILIPSAGAKIHGVGEICDFRLKWPFISETVRVGPWLLWNVMCRFRRPWMTLKGGTQGSNFSGGYRGSP